MKLIILAGGKGMRLGLKKIPKSMVRVGQIPLLEHQINLAKRYGITEIFVLSGHLSEKIVNYFGDGKKWGVTITHLIESSPLGTGGCLRMIERLIGEKELFMVLYGDIMLDINLRKFMEAATRNKESVTILAHPSNHFYDSDLIEINKENKVVKFHKKPHSKGRYYHNLAVGSVYALSGRIFKFFPKKKFFDFNKDLLPSLINAKQNVMAYRTAEYLKDIGTLSRLRLARNDYRLRKTSRLNNENVKKAIFLDRDGVINKFVPDLSNIKDFSLIKEAGLALKKINKSEYLAILITNQPQVAKGFLTEKKLDEMHKKMETFLGEQGVYFDGIYYCPHHPENGFKGEVKALKMECECRKPKIGMLTKATDDFNIVLKQSWIIGDSKRDILCGKNAGCKTIFVGNKHKTEVQPDYCFNNLLTAINFILKRKIIN